MKLTFRMPVNIHFQSLHRGFVEQKFTQTVNRYSLLSCAMKNLLSEMFCA